MQPFHVLYDLEKLDTPALEREVTRHIRFPRALLELEVVPDCRVRPHDEMQVVTAQLIPGGRWLLTGGQRPSEMNDPNSIKCGYISLYDLDAEGEALVPIAQVVLDKWVQNMVIQSTLDGNAVTIVTCSGTPYADQLPISSPHLAHTRLSRFLFYSATRYDLDVIVLTWPSKRDETISFRKAARFANMPRMPRRLTLESNTVAFDSGFAIAFWLWQTNQFMSGHIFDHVRSSNPTPLTS